MHAIGAVTLVDADMHCLYLPRYFPEATSTMTVQNFPVAMDVVYFIGIYGWLRGGGFGPPTFGL
jgi:hypothetical protein